MGQFVENFRTLLESVTLSRKLHRVDFNMKFESFFRYRHEKKGR